MNLEVNAHACTDVLFTSNDQVFCTFEVLLNTDVSTPPGAIVKISTESGSHCLLKQLPRVAQDTQDGFTPP